MFREEFPSVASKQAELSHGLTQNLSFAQKPKQLVQKPGITKDRQCPKTTGSFLGTRETGQKTIGPFAPTGAPQTKVNTYLERWKEITSDPEILNIVSEYQIPLLSIPIQLHVPVTKMFRFNSFPCRCRSEQSPINRCNKINTLLKRKLPQQTVSCPEKGWNLPSCDRPQSAQQFCRELPFSNGEHFLSEENSKKGKFYDMHRSKGCISLHPCTQVLTKVPVFPIEKQMLCLPRPTIWAKYSPQGIYKANKTHNSFLWKRGIKIIVCLDDFLILGSSVEESKANTQLTLDLLQWLGFTINWEKSALAPTQSLTFPGLSIDSQTMLLSLPEKKILNIKNKCKSLICNPTPSAREVGTLEAACPAIWQAPPALQTITDTAHKNPTGSTRQFRDTHAPKQ